MNNVKSYIKSDGKMICTKDLIDVSATEEWSEVMETIFLDGGENLHQNSNMWDALKELARAREDDLIKKSKTEEKDTLFFMFGSFAVFLMSFTYALMGAAGGWVAICLCIFCTIIILGGMCSLQSWRDMVKPIRERDEQTEECLRLCHRSRNAEKYRAEVVNSGRELLNLDLQVIKSLNKSQQAWDSWLRLHNGKTPKSKEICLVEEDRKNKK